MKKVNSKFPQKLIVIKIWLRQKCLKVPKIWQQFKEITVTININLLDLLLYVGGWGYFFDLYVNFFRYSYTYTPVFVCILITNYNHVLL